MALNVNIGIGPIGKMMPICLADKRNTLTHTCSGCANNYILSAVRLDHVSIVLILEAKFCLNGDLIHCIGLLHLN